MITLLCVAGAGAVGAPARFVLDLWVSSRTEDRFPYGTLVINVTGSLVLGLVTGLALYHGLGALPKAVVGTGFCGAYTTFSTFSYETVELLAEGTLEAAVRNVAASLVLGLLAAGTGLGLAAVL